VLGVIVNWEAIGAIGELLGSIAVIATLLYLVRQLKSSEIATLNSTQSSIQMTRIAVNSHRYEHLELILKANDGEELSRLEEEQLRVLYSNEQQTMFFTFMNFRRLGADGDIQAFNFARYLYTYPAMIECWNRDTSEWASRNEVTTIWREKVNHYLSELQAERTDT
jgi:hypothetical protein